MYVAVYWWRIHPGKEGQFRKAWCRGTELITERYGSYGSRLHLDTEGRFVAYAEWPDEEHAQFRTELDRMITAWLGDSYRWAGPSTASGLRGLHYLPYGGIDVARTAAPPLVRPALVAPGYAS